MPALADLPVVKATTTITGTSTNVTILPLTGQSSCNVEIVGTAAGTTQGLVQGTWVNVNSVAIPDGNAGPSPTLPGAGSYTANCASFQGFRFVPTSVSGSATITVVATSGVGRVIGAGVNGGKTIVAGTSPITVVNTGSVATVGLTTPLATVYGGTGQTSYTPNNCIYVGSAGLLDGSNGGTGSLFAIGSGSYSAGSSYGLSGNPTVAIAQESTIKVTNTTSGVAYGFAPYAVSPGPQNVGVAFFGSISGTLSVYSGGGPAVNTALSTGDSSHSASTGLFTTYTYTLPSASTVALPAGTWLKFYNPILGTGVYATLTSTLSIGNTTLSYYVQSQIGTPTSSLSSVNITSLSAGSFGTGAACVTSITSGSSNVTVTQPTSGNYAIAVATSSPGAVYTSGPGINITGTTISNTGALSVASGSANVTVTQPTTGNYSIAVATPSPAPVATPVSVTAGNGISVATPSAGVFNVSNTGVLSLVAGSNITLATSSPGVYTISAPSPAPTYTAGTGISIVGTTISNTGVTGVTGSGNIQVSVGPTPTVSITNTPAFSTIGFNTTNSVPQFTWTNAANAGGSQSFAFDSYNGVNVGGILPNAYGIDLYAGPGSNNFIQALDGSGNMAVKGDLYAVGKAASSGKCVQFGSNGLLGAAAAACGAGSVTGLTAGSNIVVGTGATPTVAVTAAPTFAGNVTAAGLVAPAVNTTGATGTGLYNWQNTTNSDSYALLTTNTGPVNGITGEALDIYSTASSTHNPSTGLMALNKVGDLGVKGSLYTSYVYSSGNIDAPTGSVSSINMNASNAMAVGSYLIVGAIGDNNCIHTTTGGLFQGTGSQCASKGTLFLPFGFYGGVVNTTIPYPYFQAPGYTAGTITVLRAACATADNGTTVFTFKDVTSSTTIGTISMANAATTATATLGSPFSLTTGHVLNAVVTTAGTATSCGLTAEGTYTLQ